MQHIEDDERKTKAGRKLKVSNAQIATLFFISFLSKSFLGTELFQRSMSMTTQISTFIGEV